MANYQLLKADIDEKVYENAQQKITGANLNAVLNAMVSTLGAEYQFAGVATKDTNPETTDAKVFYIANGKGTYTNFGGINVTEDDVVVLYWDTEWHKVATGIASQEKLTELESLLASTKLLVRPGRILPASINNGAWQIKTEYHHIVVPVITGSTVEFITAANGIYYGFLQNYIMPVDGVIPSYVQGYEGRQWTSNPLVIPEGCNYLIIEIGEEITPTSLIINGFELVNGYGQYLMSISKERALHYFDSLETKVYSSFFKNNVSKDYGIKSVSTNFAFTSAVLKQYYNRNVSEGSYSQVFRIDFIVDGTNIDFIHTVLNGAIKTGYDTFTIIKGAKKVTVSLNWQPYEEELSLEFVPDTILHEVVDNSIDNIIADLPTSNDGSDIDVGYAYINAATGVVTVKLG